MQNVFGLSWVRQLVNWSETLRYKYEFIQNDLALLSNGIEGNQAKQFDRSENLRFIPDENLTRGGCYIKTPFGDFDATMESKWARVIEAFHRRPKPQNHPPKNKPTASGVDESIET